MKAYCGLCLLVVLYGPLLGRAESGTAHRIAISLDPQASTNEILVAETLKQRLLQNSELLSIQVGDGPADLHLWLGEARSTGKLKDLCDQHEVLRLADDSAAEHVRVKRFCDLEIVRVDRDVIEPAEMRPALPSATGPRAETGLHSPTRRWKVLARLR